MASAMAVLLMALSIWLLIGPISAYNEFGLSDSGNGEYDCPEDCHCHRDSVRISLVTDCSESNLTGVPHDGLSRNVYLLDMNGNNVEHLAPFPPDIKLRSFQIAHNRLTELAYDSFANLTYLLDADFSYNRITKVDPEAFRDCPGLINLELQHNPLSEIQGPFLNCRPLKYLDLSACGIRSLNSEFFQNTSNIIKLYLSNNPLGHIEPGPFDHLTNLEYLKLSNCSLTSISPEVFRDSENLRELELDENDLRSLNWNAVLTPLVRLEYLNLRKTKITNLPGDAFAKNRYLTRLVLADNELHHLDVESTLGHNLHNLQSLDLSNCHLQDRLSEEAFRNASNLRDLNLNGNPMFAADLTVVLQHLPELHKLSLSNCKLRRLPEAFENLEHLQELDISYNPLSDAFVHLLNPLKSLEYLDMSYCNLGHVGNNTFTLMTSLKKLIMSGNMLHSLEEGLFTQLTRLESLELNDCGLKHPIDPKVFGDRPYANIIELKLSKNPLAVPKEGPLLPDQLSGVEIIDLSYCDIGRLHEDVFSDTRNLTTLNLSNNKLTGADNLTFLNKLRQLEHLDLSNNSLSTIRPRVFHFNPRLLSVNLMGNPFVCNCSIAEMWDWALKEKNDLDVLVGSQPSQYTTGAVKLRKTLSCSYDSKETNRNLVRTWAKYIRESQCHRSS
ncbi:carboxypeptidase N subunit 2-like isoform X2 [Copidosoma floridanum]|nr:carboxypeptidase N subunit 2-like isoform X2 [Copidosoma floridanum]XP_014204422.1 carboxypeptidase N subunit 2-like isoform X2 [Copidosoma floridanum]